MGMAGARPFRLTVPARAWYTKAMVRDYESWAALLFCMRAVRQNPRLAAMAFNRQHGDTSCLLHSVAVALYSLRLARAFRLRVCARALVRGALLHDYFLYDWHEKDASHRLHGFHHPRTALVNAGRDYALTPVERDIILKHMFPLTPRPPRYLESLLVCLVDKGCSLYETAVRRNAYPGLRPLVGPRS